MIGLYNYPLEMITLQIYVFPNNSIINLSLASNKTAKTGIKLDLKKAKS